MTFRDVKRQMRRTLHNVLRTPVVYISPDGTVKKVVRVRLHYVFAPEGDLKGTNFHYAETQDVNPRVIFMRNEVDKPERAAVVYFSPNEAYRVDNIEPPDDITVKAEVIRLLPKDPFWDSPRAQSLPELNA